jgi:hypothetical protein
MLLKLFLTLYKGINCGLIVPNNYILIKNKKQNRTNEIEMNNYLSVGDLFDDNREFRYFFECETTKTDITRLDDKILDKMF